MDWENELLEQENALKEKGYIRYSQSWRSETFSYWKTFRNKEGEKLYQICVLFYDWREFSTIGSSKRLGIQYECLLIGNNRLDMACSSRKTLEEFEEMSLIFYENLKKYL